MKQAQEAVRAFHYEAGALISITPTPLDDKTIELRLKLIREETDELEVALRAHDLVETADALADLLYVALGACVSSGIEISAIFDEVHRSNMSKFIDGYMRSDGKWMKGKSWTPPDIAPMIKRQEKWWKGIYENPCD